LQFAIREYMEKITDIISSIAAIVGVFKSHPKVAEQRARRREIRNQIRAKKAEKKLQKLQKKIDKLKK